MDILYQQAIHCTSTNCPLSIVMLDCLRICIYIYVSYLFQLGVQWMTMIPSPLGRFSGNNSNESLKRGGPPRVGASRPEQTYITRSASRRQTWKKLSGIYTSTYYNSRNSCSSSSFFKGQLIHPTFFREETMASLDCQWYSLWGFHELRQRCNCSYIKLTKIQTITSNLVKS